MASAKEQVQRLIALRQRLAVDEPALKNMQETRSVNRADFDKGLRALADQMRDSKTAVLYGKKQTLKEQLKLKGHDPKLDQLYKVAKVAIDEMSKFYVSTLPPVIKRCKETAKAFNKALAEIESDLKSKGKGQTPEAETFRKLYLDFQKTRDRYKLFLEDALEAPDKRPFDKSKALKQLEDDFNIKISDYSAIDDEF